MKVLTFTDSTVTGWGFYPAYISCSEKPPTNPPKQAIDEAALRRFGDAVEARSGVEVENMS